MRIPVTVGVAEFLMQPYIFIPLLVFLIAATIYFRRR
jgi:hypothetical protein